MEGNQTGQFSNIGKVRQANLFNSNGCLLKKQKLNGEWLMMINVNNKMD